MEFKHRLKELRKEFDMKQKDLGATLGLGATAIANYESGRNKPSIGMLHVLTDIFHVSTDYLIGYSDIKYPYRTDISDDDESLIRMYGNLSQKNKDHLRSYAEFIKHLADLQGKREEMLQTIPLTPAEKSDFSFRDRLRELRTEQGLSQANLAAKLEYNPATIAGYEAGRTEPSMDVLCVLAETLHVSVDYLTGYSGIRAPYENTPIAEADEPFLNTYLQLPSENKTHLRAYAGYLSFLELIPEN